MDILCRVRSERIVGPEEGIDDAETIDSYEKLNRQLPFKIVYMVGLRRLKKLTPQGVLADLGCGPGYFTKRMANAFPDLKIIAFDISEEMLKRAKRNITVPGNKNKVRFEQGDIRKLPFDDDSLDFVVSTLSLHHWENPQESFREIYRVLKPQGQFMVYDTRRDSPKPFYLVMKFAQKYFLPKNLIVKNEPTSSIEASYTPGEALDLIKEILFTEKNASGGVFWLFLTGKKG